MEPLSNHNAPPISFRSQIQEITADRHEQDATRQSRIVRVDKADASSSLIQYFTKGVKSGVHHQIEPVAVDKRHRVGVTEPQVNQRRRDLLQ